mmetsp:Transcript_32166/g.77076  ORF Transcript_32166/g.77076 Transcript_32166/m.77076 type:complete len:308 (+) Transcript_32166:9-932(+)
MLRTSRPRAMRSLQQLASSVDAFIFDCDGVLWRGDEPIPGAREAVAALRQQGKKIFFITNNATKSRAGFLTKLQSMGYSADTGEAKKEVLSSAFAAAAFLRTQGFPENNKKVYVIGEVGIMDELATAGIPALGGPLDSDKVPPFGKGQGVHVDPSVGAVVVGLDRSFCYYKLHYAQLCLNTLPGCQFVATNPDALMHATDVQEWPGAGCFVAALKYCTKTEPVLVGKPERFLIDHVLREHKLDPGRICMVGDRLDTDILFANRNGLQSLLVMSGITTPDILQQAGPDTGKPDVVTESVADMLAQAKL